jgi:hypothetical protein
MLEISLRTAPSWDGSRDRLPTVQTCGGSHPWLLFRRCTVAEFRPVAVTLLRDSECCGWHRLGGVWTRTLYSDCELSSRFRRKCPWRSANRPEPFNRGGISQPSQGVDLGDSQSWPARRL